VKVQVLPFNHTKAKEWIIAIRLERQYTKKMKLLQCTAMLRFCNYSVGVSSAAQTYFLRPKGINPR
jgi:penicillin-binding protein 1A